MICCKARSRKSWSTATLSLGFPMQFAHVLLSSFNMSCGDARQHAKAHATDSARYTSCIPGTRNAASKVPLTIPPQARPNLFEPSVNHVVSVGCPLKCSCTPRTVICCVSIDKVPVCSSYDGGVSSVIHSKDTHGLREGKCSVASSSPELSESNRVVRCTHVLRAAAGIPGFSPSAASICK